ncbi:Hypothetical protein EAG7_04276 [Klebsiella aerogenes]|nr:Hypothetical protein EAG7_04276 [Klebsiella aerogenes]
MPLAGAFSAQITNISPISRTKNKSLPPVPICTALTLALW